MPPAETRRKRESSSEAHASESDALPPSYKYPQVNPNEEFTSSLFLLREQ